VEARVDEPDPQVVAAAKAGSLGAFEHLVRRYQGDAWRLAYHLLHDNSLADDVTQDAFVRVFRFLPRYRGDSKFSTWLFSIVRNCAMDELRRLGRRSVATRRAHAGESVVVADPGVRLEVKEALAGLPLELREPVVMIDMFGLSYKEAGAVLGIPEGTVKSRVHRARSNLAQVLGPGRGESTGEA
jgi:RNA polymerase sigma-70 factor (ECF subfamily)